jgi:hypothetical protein
MMKKLLYILIITFVLTLLFVKTGKIDQKVIKFFPIDESIQFTDYTTDLSLLQQTDKDTYKINWAIESTLKEPIKLRQDLSLLFIDGKLKGILNQWKEEADELKQQTTINGEDSSQYESITFHHGEIHYPDDVIKSIQKMSHDELYVIDSPHSPIETFREPVSQYEIEWKKTLDHTKFQQLTYFWNRLMNHYQINKEDYLEIPLSQLWYYEHEPFPTLTMEQTEQVIGQLWEGLYKHYIFGINSQSTEDYNPLNTYMPLILVDKKGTHLYVLYEDITGENQRLIQQIPDFN